MKGNETSLRETEFKRAHKGRHCYKHHGRYDIWSGFKIQYSFCITNCYCFWSSLKTQWITVKPHYSILHINTQIYFKFTYNLLILDKKNPYKYCKSLSIWSTVLYCWFHYYIEKFENPYSTFPFNCAHGINEK